MLTGKQLTAWIAGGVIAIALVSLLRSPKASAAIRARLIEVVLPGSPFSISMRLFQQSDYNVIGATTGTLGVTNLTLTNLGTVDYRVDVFFAVLRPGGLCRKQDIIGQGLSDLYINVPLNQTVSISYPTPMTGHDPTTPACIGASVVSGSGAVQVAVTGFMS